MTDPDSTHPDSMQRDYLQRYQQTVTGVFGTPQRVLVRGRGATVWDADGAEYLDLLGGIAVNILGHAHPRILAALSAQAATLGHISNLFTSPAQVQLAEKLLELAQAPDGSVFFSNSGSEANEAALKIARAYGKQLSEHKTRIICVEQAFHGRTLGAVSVTAKQAYRDPFEPLLPAITRVPAGDLDQMVAAVDETVAAVLIEPVQGESGVHGYPAGYLAAVRDLCDRHGALLIFDEVQSGSGRTGTWFAYQNPAVTGQEHPVVPDVVTLAKSLGGGFPIGATVCLNKATSMALSAGQHGTTFGGNPLACAVALEVLHTLEEENLLERAQAIGRSMATHLTEIEGIETVRVYGAWAGIDVSIPDQPADQPRPARDDLNTPHLAARAVTAAAEAGFLINATSPTTLRLAPSLVVTDEQLDSFYQRLPALVATASQNHTR
ncbi:acetylornithine transaminase [Auritidibacter ignavus]|uniref:Acetylornithine transaminase n=1 Tax=Auritidibacter ignavus TaxID=678932 RepID=A0AAJ6AIC6_9MICC|nr:acetylornithine transaminase [Auritidibacter ignavus]WGH84654.1 acetylornithine transaminase [Auritidibacter ignavus]WGH86966.1 acetylornithine transaminase [Auritidibacter ignavus]WGH89251.1 acetylornithine transaminase [Auritidibacter ignavus]WGH94023.1 acetylornithine transaminase [Auritidibacter ignavus]